MKIVKRQIKGRIKAIIIDYDLPTTASPHSESWEFFEKTSLEVIKKFSGVLEQRYDGPDSSRWICVFNSITLLFDYDDMLGMNISVDSKQVDNENVFESIINFVSNM